MIYTKRRAQAKRGKSMSAQVLAMRFWSQFQYIHEHNCWIGTVQPSEDGQRYKIKVVYRRGAGPRVYVLEPALRDDAPHRNRDGSLGLYYPPDGSWTEKKLIALTIMPWACEYLYLYEIWLTTGTWYGITPTADEIARDRAAGRI